MKTFSSCILSFKDNWAIFMFVSNLFAGFQEFLCFIGSCFAYMI